MTLTKALIVQNLFAKNLFTKGESVQTIATLFELMKQALERGDDVLISEFGKICVRQKNQRTGRNPQTGESMVIAPRTVITFKCSGVLKEKVNWNDKSIKAKK